MHIPVSAFRIAIPGGGEIEWGNQTDIHANMQAIVLSRNGNGYHPTVVDIPAPTVGAGDVLIDMRAVSLNRADLRFLPTHFSHQDDTSGPLIAGLEVAGEVACVGSDVRGFSIGDRVMAMTSRAFADLVAVDHRLVVHVPDHFSWAQAAGTMISFVTANDALHNAAQIRHGDSVMVVGGTTAAGIATIQLANNFGAGRIWATTRDEGKSGRLRALGCNHVIVTDYSTGPDSVASQCGGQEFNVIIDTVGGNTLRDLIEISAVKARIICLGRVGGGAAEFDLNQLSRKRISIIGVSFRTRSLAEHSSAIDSFKAHALPFLEGKTLRPVIDKELEFPDISSALSHTNTAKQFGKIVMVRTHMEGRV